MAGSETVEPAMPREVKVIMIEAPKKFSMTLDSMRRRKGASVSVKKSEDGAGAESAALDEDGGTEVFFHADVIEPPLPLEVLVRVYEESNSLRQNIDAMSTNVDGFGFEIVPSMPLEGAEADGMVADKIEDDGKEPTAEAVKERLATIVKKVGRERRRARNFFQFCCDEGFIELRRRSRDDLEALGNFYWEILRDKAGRICRFVHLPAYTMRLTKLGDPIDVEIKRKVDPVTFEETKEKRRFRRFVQLIGGETRWFKEFGDPRIMSRKSGIFHKSEDEITAKLKEDSDEGVATEVIHFKIPALKGPYGTPRWIGNILSVRGSRLAEEVNYYYFRKKAIPPMMIFVEDGTLSGDAVERLTLFFQQIMGETEKHWSVPVIEGESAEEAKNRGVQWSGTPKFKIEKLMDQQLKDALFQTYDQNNRDKVGESFRIPRLLRGDVRDMTRATATVGKAFGEQQVFQPERDREDNMINRKIMPALDFKYVEFRTRAPIMRDPISLTEMVSALVKAGVLTPEEGREISEDIFNREFVRIKEDWVKRPLALTLAGVVGTAETAKTARESLGLGAPGSPIDVARVVSRLREIRDHFEDLVDETPEGTVYGALGGEGRRRHHDGDSGNAGSSGSDRDD